MTNQLTSQFSVTMSKITDNNMVTDNSDNMYIPITKM